MTTIDHRPAALRRANEIRFKRSQIKRRLKTRQTTLEAVLLGDNTYLQTMRLAELLRAVPGLGRVKIERTLRDLHLSPTVQLRHVSLRRRQELLAYLAQRLPKIGKEFAST